MKHILEKINKRYLSAMILLPLTFLIIIIGGFLFNLAIIIASIILIYEFITLTTENKKLNDKKSLLITAFYIAIPASLLINMRYLDNGIEAILYILTIVFITDSSAYFGGRYFKGIKLAPKISPNKTVSGAIIALFSTLLFAIFAFLISNGYSFLYFTFVSLLISISSQIGDLLESFIKRKIGVKDSGNLIPGHGGLFDRVDGILPAIIIGYILL